MADEANAGNLGALPSLNLPALPKAPSKKPAQAPPKPISKKTASKPIQKKPEPKKQPAKKPTQKKPVAKKLRSHTTARQRTAHAKTKPKTLSRNTKKQPTREERLMSRARAKVIKKAAAPKKKRHITVRKIKPQRGKLQTNKEIAMDFAVQLHKKFDAMIKATVLFGSQVTNTAQSGSDIDIIIIIDDASINWDLELIAWYREELSRLIAKTDYARELHVNTIKLTTWWNDLMHGDPVVINILRYGEALVDIGGFFKPLKALLLNGQIHATPEAVQLALQRAPTHLARSKQAELNAIEGVYWAMVDSAQAALITLGKLPPSPEHITQMLKEIFVDQNMMHSDYVKWYANVFALHKEIAHHKLRHVKGSEIELWQERAEKFILQMTKIIDELIDARKQHENQ